MNVNKWLLFREGEGEGGVSPTHLSTVYRLCVSMYRLSYYYILYFQCCCPWYVPKMLYNLLTGANSLSEFTQLPSSVVITLSSVRSWHQSFLLSPELVWKWCSKLDPGQSNDKKKTFSLVKLKKKKKTVMCALMLVFFMSFQPVHAILLVLFSFSMKEWIFSGVFPGATLSRRSCGKFCGCTTHQVDIKTIEPWNQKHQFIGLILTSRSLTTQPSLLDRQRWAESLNRCSTGKIILLSGSSVFSDSFIGLIISLLLLIQNAMLIPLAVSCLALS